MSKENQDSKKPEVRIEGVTTNQPIDKSQPIIKESKGDKPYGEVIEEARFGLQDLYKKSRRMSNIFMVITVALLIAGIILFSQKSNSGFQVGGGILMGAALAILLVQYFLTKNKFPNASKIYVKKVVDLLNGHTFVRPEFKDLKYDPDEKIADSDILADGVYNAISSSGSRNVVYGLYNNHSFRIADLALYRPGAKAKQQDLSFIGKYLTSPNKLSFEGRYLITIFNPVVETPVDDNNTTDKKENKIDQPNNIEGLVVLEESGNIIVRGPEGGDYKAVLGQKFLDFISHIQIDKTLLNVNIAIWAGHTACYYSYGDEIIGLPFEKPFVSAPFDEFVEDFNKLMEGLSLIS